MQGDEDKSVYAVIGLDWGSYTESEMRKTKYVVLTRAILLVSGLISPGFWLEIEINLFEKQQKDSKSTNTAVEYDTLKLMKVKSLLQG